MSLPFLTIFPIARIYCCGVFENPKIVDIIFISAKTGLISRMFELGTISTLLNIQKRPLDIAFSNHPLSKNRHQGKTTSPVNGFQNTFFFFKKYRVNLILFANHSEHTFNRRIIYPPKKLNPR
jgi:hypothetical protein